MAIISCIINEALVMKYEYFKLMCEYSNFLSHFAVTMFKTHLHRLLYYKLVVSSDFGRVKLFKKMYVSAYHLLTYIATYIMSDSDRLTS